MMDSSTRRARITSAGSIRLEVSPPVSPGTGEAVIAVESCGLCGSDLAMFSGTHPVIRLPITPGHEVVGTVLELAPESADPASGLVPGARVAILPQTGCGHCEACRRDDPRLCDEMKLIGGQIAGGLADRLIAPVANLLVVPDAVPASLRALVEPLAVACHAVDRGRPAAGDRCLVIGGGPIGVFSALVLRAKGVAAVTVVEPLEPRREIASGLGLKTVEAVTGASEFDLAFDCVGGAEAPALALSSVVPGGRVVLVGVSTPNLQLDGMRLQRQERSVSGTHMYTRADFSEALDLLASGLIPDDPAVVGSLIDVRRLDDIEAVFADFAGRRSTSLKIVVTP